MPPAPPDSAVGRARGPVGVARRIRPRIRDRGRDPGSGSDLGPDPGSDGSDASSRRAPLEALLVDLGSQLQPATSVPRPEAADRFQPTGLAGLDARLGGGFPRDRLSEICGAPSSGRTALALALLAETLCRGVLAAWIDWANAFDPASAAAASGDLERLLWVRARSGREALRSCERLLQTDGFELVVLDLAFAGAPSPAGPAPRAKTARAPTRAGARPRTRDEAIRDVAWLRLARLAASTRTMLVVLSNAPSTGSRAELVLEMKTGGARFAGPPGLLDGLESTAVVRRHRSRPIGERVPVSIRAEPEPDGRC